MAATVDQTPVLEVRNISKAFPGVQALSNVDFKVYPNEVVALIGENGAGKSTLMKILSGAYKMDSGSVYIAGEPIEPQNPHHAQSLGISIIYQEFNLTPNQTVATNIFLGREPSFDNVLGRAALVNRRQMRHEAARLLERVGARFSPDALVRNLSVAERQMVEIAKALSFESRIIIMDEPTSALGEGEVKVLFDIVRGLKEQGLGVIFITHRLDEIFEIADRVVVLRDGRQVGELPIAEATPPKLIAMMVGRPLVEMYQKQDTSKGDVVLEVRDLSRTGVIDDVSFSLRKGEILGIAGLVGSGRTEMVRAIFGADPRTSGEIFIDGQPVDIHSPNAAIRAGMALVPENRQLHGLVLEQSVERNIVLPNLDWLSTGLTGLLKRGQAREVAERYVRQLNVRTPSLAQRVKLLSGGNQQKVVLAKWLASSPKVLILDEPTRGIDVGAKAEVHALMSQLAAQGIGIVMISSEMPEVLQMSDRILIMHEGRVAGILDRTRATQEVIMAYASGETDAVKV
ncbi:MAG: sugar ABC transporter ATP-binding protein [Chloroflexi bacterium]|nr:sugar ABC transporter ATP-binding protein [Chloroflexota bacterium]